jgi:hypothetical protein
MAAEPWLQLKAQKQCWTCGSQSGDYEECFLACNAVLSGKFSPMLWKTYCHHLQGLKVSQASVRNYQASKSAKRAYYSLKYIVYGRFKRKSFDFKNHTFYQLTKAI